MKVQLGMYLPVRQEVGTIFGMHGMTFSLLKLSGDDKLTENIYLLDEKFRFSKSTFIN